jgi:hypothetical protein
MVGAVDQHDGVVGEVGIEVVPGRLATVRQIGNVVAVSDNPFAGLQVELLDVALQHLDDVGDAGHRPHRRAGDVGPLDDLRGVHEVAVGIDE